MKIGWTHLNFDIPLRHRLTVTVPMAVLGLVDNIVCLLTIGYVQPGLSLDWGFHQAFRNARKGRKEASR